MEQLLGLIRQEVFWIGIEAPTLSYVRGKGRMINKERDEIFGKET
jgi:hypothetical protein